MKPFIVLPLAENESRRVPKFNVDFFEVKTSHLDHPFDHIFWAEIGKFIKAAKRMNYYLSGNGPTPMIKEMNMSKFGIKGFIQNRRFFKNLDSIQIYNENEVILAEEEFLGGLNIMDQFRYCHPGAFKIFKDIIQNKLKVPEKVYESMNSIPPHNIFLSKIDFFFQYATFLEDILMPYFDEKYTEKYGAWIAERLLYFYSYMYYRIRTEPIITLPKINM